MHVSLVAHVPEDTLLLVLLFLPYPDVLRVMQTCKRFRHVASAKQLWLKIMKYDVQAASLPFPACSLPLDSLSATQTKLLVTHALKLHRVTTASVEVVKPLLVPCHQRRPLTWVHLVNGQWLLVASSDLSSSSLALHSVAKILHGDKTSRVAEAFLTAAVKDGSVDVGEDGNVIVTIALELCSSTPAFEILSLNQDHHEINFVRLARYTDVAHLQALKGSLIGYALHGELSLPSILDWETGSVVHLRSRPDIAVSTSFARMLLALPSNQGGCHRNGNRGNYVAILTPKELQVIQLHDMTEDPRGFISIFTLRLGMAVGFADLAFVTDTAQHPRLLLRMCMSKYVGVFAYSIPVETQELRHNGLQEYQVWSYLTPEDLDGVECGPFPMQVRWGKTCATVSWLEVLYSAFPTSAPVYFKTSAYNVLREHVSEDSLARTIYYEAQEPSLPAAYAMSVRDYDDVLGLLAVGNAFGELALYSLTGSTLEELSDTLQHIVFPPSDGLDIVSKTHVQGRSAMPYLFHPFYQLNGEEWPTIVNSWRPHRPTTLPDGWREPGLKWEPSFSGHFETVGWRVENTCHYLGRPIPIMHCNQFILIKTGGLFMLVNTDTKALAIINPELSLPEILDLISLHPNRVAWIPMYVYKAIADRSVQEYSILLRDFWCQEREECGIDRFEALKDRGGQLVVDVEGMS